ncbi:ECF transporter S component [Cytobacillus sp. Hm23]|uniref:ECF transporter S component n=1 Tax=Cytobacillus sp. IB215665 TaxID=3097357 RepID=UPI002A1115EF|nr:ECF transporter S component [Cytobacillus sp. IB215665]MDX8364811.1 ECF transporter S component [Cytobacillus sp. IB215665]
MERQNNVRKLVTVGVLSSISFILMMLDFPLPGIPPYLKIDFSEVPALIAAIVFGPAAGITVEAIKNILHYFFMSSAVGVPVGQAANFIAGLLFILPVSYIYRKYNSKTGLTFGLIVGTIVMTLMMAVLNMFIILPAYTMFLGYPAMSNLETMKLIAVAFMPFNLIKGGVITIVFLLLFTRMRTWLEQQQRALHNA